MTVPTNKSLEEEFDLSAHWVATGHFYAQISVYEEMYRESYPEGWGDFLAKYSKGETDPSNLDYDEWAFLCEHFMQRLTQGEPPGSEVDCQEKPENVSGFSFGRKVIFGEPYCLIHKYISARSSKRLHLVDARNGLKPAGQN